MVAAGAKDPSTDRAPEVRSMAHALEEFDAMLAAEPVPESPTEALMRELGVA
jgi:hypothetical protein